MGLVQVIPRDRWRRMSAEERGVALRALAEEAWKSGVYGKHVVRCESPREWLARRAKAVRR